MKNNLINNTTTNDYTIFNQNYMAPFTNITNFLKAVYVVIKLYSKSHNFNISTIQNAISSHRNLRHFLKQKHSQFALPYILKSIQ
jgi:hypothetical protein